ncbi:hypothetical protein [Williamsia sterculiae]|uniref:Uncharacterized protein n=1 Tax=Williamsia sterculiae TaxID=1344003 RepID=A0A1N7EKU0_9NOCA|nr:hypothetical protein [Williamsia sterculiae]SIR88717.1 hypothetical protein SAMN05445060_1418 [Williamsia sterculiae]
MTELDFDARADARGAITALGTWAAAWRSDRCAPDDVLDAMAIATTVGDTSPLTHRVTGAGPRLGGGSDDAGSEALLTLIRSAEEIGILLVAPGDLHGLPAGPARAAALDTGEVLLLTFASETSIALSARRVDRYTVTWGVHDAGTATVPVGRSLAEMEYALREGVRDAAQLLGQLGGPGARTPADLRQRIAAAATSAHIHLPPETDPRVDRVLAQSAQVEAIVVVAEQTSREFGLTAAARDDGDRAFAALWTLTRAARMTALNTVIADLAER